MARVVDLEPQLKTFLAANGVTQTIRLQQFGLKTPARAVLIRRDGTGPRPVELDIDPARVFVMARAASALQSFTDAKQIADLLDGFGPGTIGTTEVLNVQLIEGPSRDDDPETRDPRHLVIFDVRAKA